MSGKAICGSTALSLSPQCVYWSQRDAQNDGRAAGWISMLLVWAQVRERLEPRRVEISPQNSALLL